MKRKLFIIGNGFDIDHKIQTRYQDFKNYILRCYPNLNVGFCGPFDEQLMPDGDVSYGEMKNIAGSIVRCIDSCLGEEWKDLENCLGDLYVETIKEDNKWLYKKIDYENEKDFFNHIYDNEDLTQSIANAHMLIKNLFERWVFDELSNIDYLKIRRHKRKPSFLNSLFLSFNYTETLEKVYKINRELICHIHGNATNNNEQVYFGHGNDEVYEEELEYIGVNEAYDGLKRKLRKNTKQAIANNKRFFESLKGVKCIYSFGFSFSDVDMCYVNEICRYINPRKTKWYFNKYDWKNNLRYVNKIKSLGFKTKKCHCW